jgi:hypothetical protein
MGTPTILRTTNLRTTNLRTAWYYAKIIRLHATEAGTSMLFDTTTM